jgi:peptidoglycan/xylan/chitin deacetylase (PgdA/CDA1 family)
MSVGKAVRNTAKKILVSSGTLRFAQKLAEPAAVVLRYHSIQEHPEQYENTIGCDSIHSTAVFARHMELIARQFHAVSLDDIALFLQGKKSLPERAIVITFDDGYKDNFCFAAPILNRFGIPGTFYALVDAVDRSAAPWYCRLRQAFWTARNSKWTDEANGTTYNLSNPEARLTAFMKVAEAGAKANPTAREELIKNAITLLDPEPFPNESSLMMTWDDARTLARSGHIVGSHTMTHPNVAQVSVDDAHRELRDSKLKLEQELGSPIKHFSYPHPALFPQWNETTLKITEELGYTTAVTTTIGAVRADARPLAIPRTYIPRDEAEFLWHLERTFLSRNSAAVAHMGA